MRAIVVAVSFLFVLMLMPKVVVGQTAIAEAAPSDSEREDRERLSLQVAVGPTLTLVGGGNVLSAAVGYSPASRLELLVNVERNHVPFQLYGSSATRGGTLTFVSGELRVALLPTDRVSPFVMAGAGRGESRPNVNTAFPDPVRNDLRVLYLGGGVRVPLRGGFSLTGDVRCLLGLEGYDGVIGIWPVRAGIAWRF